MTATAMSGALTVPNALSVLRLLGVPLFCWLALGPEADGAAVAVLMISGATDYLDGWLARVLNQMSRVGELLDPLADRLYILATLVVLAIRDITPWWLVAALLARDVAMTGVLGLLRRHGYGPPPVHVLGKSATFCLLYAFPLLLLGDGSGAWPTTARVIGWAFACWGTSLYWWAGLLYGAQARNLLRRDAATRSDNVYGGGDTATDTATDTASSVVAPETVVEPARGHPDGERP